MGLKKKKSNKKKSAFPSVEHVLNKKRIITIFGEIDESMSRKVIKELLKLDYIARLPITLLINSPGGHCTDGLAIIDCMNGCRSPVHTIIMGEACSMAALISVSGDQRGMTENSFWMAHPMTAGAYDYKKFVLDRVEYIKVLDAKMEVILSSRTKLTAEDVQKYTHGELWLTSEQALRKGVVDQALGSRVFRYRYPTVKKARGKNARKNKKTNRRTT